MNEKNIRKKDKRSALVTVVLIFCICTSLCLYFYLTMQPQKFSSYKELIVKKAERQHNLQKDQASYQKLCDSLFIRIDRFNPEINASFEESDIKFLITDLKNMYEKNSWDKRYKMFYHVALFYDMWFADKRVLWSKKNNVNTFRENLEQCEMGLTKKENELTKRQKRN